MTFDIVDLNQLELDPNAPRTRATVILIEGAFDKSLQFGNSGGGTLTGGGGSTQVPALLLLAYANDAAYFDAYAQDFHGLVTRLWLR